MSRILVVDDSEDDLILMTEYLLDLGHKCKLASSGKMALEIISIESFDLVITDFRMGDGDGLWLISKLKDQGVSLNCLLVTSDSEYTEEFFTRNGASGFCRKPILWNHLKAELDRLL